MVWEANRLQDSQTTTIYELRRNAILCRVKPAMPDINSLLWRAQR